jgi:hypothetical protein
MGLPHQSRLPWQMMFTVIVGNRSGVFVLCLLKVKSKSGWRAQGNREAFVSDPRTEKFKFKVQI